MSLRIYERNDLCVRLFSIDDEVRGVYVTITIMIVVVTSCEDIGLLNSFEISTCQWLVMICDWNKYVLTLLTNVSFVENVTNM